MTLEKLGLDKPAPRPTAEYFHTRLTYDPFTEIFVWLKRPERNRWDRTWNTKNAGNRAGTKHSTGYWYIKIDNNLYLTSKLAWLYMTCSWPKQEIDHRNLNRADDRWENLREATHSQNNINKGPQADNTSGHTGVGRMAGKWQATDQVNGRQEYLGLFSHLDDAIAARKSFEVQYFGEFAYQPNGAK